MGKKKALILTVCGAVATLLVGIFIIVGVFDYFERGQYQNVGMNTPAIVLLAVLFVASVVAQVVGIRKMKSGK